MILKYWFDRPQPSEKRGPPLRQVTRNSGRTQLFGSAIVLAFLHLVQFALFVFSKYLDALVPLYFEMCGLQRLRMKSGPIVEYTCPGFRGRNMLNFYVRSLNQLMTAMYPLSLSVRNFRISRDLAEGRSSLFARLWSIKPI